VDRRLRRCGVARACDRSSRAVGRASRLATNMHLWCDNSRGGRGDTPTAVRRGASEGVARTWHGLR
jgi:hypothetical protein